MLCAIEMSAAVAIDPNLPSAAARQVIEVAQALASLAR
jgi:hypothetical protein